jgi:integrase
MPSKTAKEKNREFPAYLNKKEDKWKRNCVSAIKSFLGFITGCERMETIEEYIPAAQKYFAEDRDHADDIIRWKKANVSKLDDEGKKTGLAPLTLNVYLSCIREFLKSGGIVLDDEDIKDLKKAFEIGMDVPEDAPDKNKIRSFLEHSDQRMTAITLLGSATGLRMGEIVGLTPEMFNRDMRMINLPKEITKGKKRGRLVFYTPEAEHALVEWERVRCKYIADHNKILEKSFRNVDRTTKTSDKIFPYDQASINRAWIKILKKSGEEISRVDKFNHAVFHPHSLRQYFSTQLRRVGCPDSYVEALLGHKKYLDTYIRFSEQEKFDLYNQYSSALVIGRADDYSKTVAAIAEKSQEMNGTIKKLETEKEDLENRVREAEQRLAQIEQGKTGTPDDKDIEEFKKFMEWKRSQKH